MLCRHHLYWECRECRTLPHLFRRPASTDTDKGENLVSKLGLQTVPTHVLVDSSGKLVSVLARKQFPNRQAVEALVATSCERDEEGFCIPCTPSKGDAGKAL